MDWLDQAHRLGGWSGGTVRWLSSTLLDTKYAGSTWRHDGGALADIGPHVLDLLDAALGEVVGVLGAYRGEPDLWQVVLSHATGAISTACMSMRLPMRPPVSDAAIYGRHGYLELPQRVESAQDCFHRLLDDFVSMVHNGQTEHRCDVSRGLHVQRIVQNIAQLAGAGPRLTPEFGRQPS
jgi:predicted dehydrogenase